MTAKLAQGIARLAFWRKSDAASPAHADLDPDASSPTPTDDAASPDVADAPVARFARLKQFASRWRGNAVVPSEEADPPAKPSALDAAEVTEEDAPPKPALLARLKSTFQRQAATDVSETDTDAPAVDARQQRETAPSREHDEDSDAIPAQPSRIRRALAILSRKWVWIPAISLVLLGMMGAMLILLMQSAQEKDRLQTELLAAQQQLDQVGGAKPAVPQNDAAKPDAPPPDDAPVVASLGAVRPQPEFDASGCVVTDKESVSQNLKHCIEAFNSATGGSRTVRAAP